MSSHSSSCPGLTVCVFNGPNLNLLGTREPAVYGAATLADVQALCEQACARHGWRLDFRQSNHEGELVEQIHHAGRLHAAGQLAGVQQPAPAGDQRAAPVLPKQGLQGLPLRGRQGLDLPHSAHRLSL